MARITTISVNYSKALHCYKIAAEADNGANYVGRCYLDSLRDLLDLIAREIAELENPELEKGGDQIACNKG